MSGLLAGILLARTVSGAVGEHFGWRPMFVLGAAAALALFAWLWRSLPRSRPSGGGGAGYGALLASLIQIWRRHAVLRRATLAQGCLFAGFSAFWATLVLMLERPPYLLGAQAAGLFGVVGLTGVLVAPLAGRMADRMGPWRVGLAGVLAVLPGWAALVLVPGLAGIALSVVLLDAGIQASMIANQAAIFALEPAARSRINTVFITGLFVGGAVGSAGGSLAWDAYGWPGVVAFGAAFAVLALVAHLPGRR